MRYIIIHILVIIINIVITINKNAVCGFFFVVHVSCLGDSACFFRFRRRHN
jgi:hypothetical protein